MTFLNRVKEKLLRFSRRAESYQDEITFSPANVQGPDTLEESVTCLEKRNPNLLVGCHGSRFPEEMMEYAIDMARRMNYDIIAVNAANLTHDITAFFSTTKETLYKDFRETAQKNIQPFRQMATDHGILFSHSIKFSGIDQAIEEIAAECGGIEFIISENREYHRPEKFMENEKQIAQRLFVYSVN